MSIVVLDALENKHHSVSKNVKQLLAEGNRDVVYFKLQDMDIKRCVACVSCSFKTPGICALKDEMPRIFKAVVNASLLVMLTPIRFGGYSSQLKKAIDRFMVLGLPLYMVKNGDLLHPMRYELPPFLVLGVLEKEAKKQEEAFRRLVVRNVINMHVPAHDTIIVKQSEDTQGVLSKLRVSLQEVSVL